jgi:hypothetical protein
VLHQSMHSDIATTSMFSDLVRILERYSSVGLGKDAKKELLERR